MKSDIHGIMLDHIAEEPGLIRGLLDARASVTADFCRIFLESNIRRVYFSGSGSPANACEVLRYFCEKLLSVEAGCIVPTVFNRHLDFNLRDYRPDETLLICPAESGRTKGSVLAARHAAGLGIHTACCTFNPGGVLGRTCDVVLAKPSGQEVALPSTKGHVVGIFLFLLCFVEAAHAVGKLSDAEYARCIEDFERLPAAMESARRSASDWFLRYQDEIMDSGSCWFIGYGANCGTARECALKFLECTKRPAFAYELEEFMHGPLAAVRSTDMLFFLCAEEGAELERMLELARFCRRITSRCVTIGKAGCGCPEMQLAFDSCGSELTSVLELLVPMQVLAYHTADCLGYDLTVHSKHSAGKAMELSFSDDITFSEILNGQ